MRNRFISSIVSIASLFCACAASYAQDLSYSTAKLLNYKILGLVDEYDRVSSFLEERDRRDFLALFEDPESSCVFNDLMHTSSFGKIVSPHEYARLAIGDGNALTRIVISNILKEGEFFFEDGAWHRKISFTKYVMTIDSGSYYGGMGGVLFDSSIIYPDEPDFNLIMDLVFDQNSGRCLIHSVQLKTPKSSTPLDDPLFDIVLKKDVSFAEGLKSDDQTLSYNEFDQALVRTGSVTLDNDDVLLKESQLVATSRYRVLDYDYKTIYHRVKPRIAFAPSHYSVNSFNSLISSSSYAAELGVDIGYEKTVASSAKLGVYTGIALSASRLTLSASDINYTIQVYSHGKQKITKDYNLELMSEDLTFLDLMVPLYASIEIPLSYGFILSADLGAKFYNNAKTFLSPYHVKGEANGESISGDYTAFVDPADYTRDMFDYSAFVNFEMDYEILPPLAYLFLSAGYEYGLKSSYDSSELLFFEEDSVYPFIYASNIDKDVPFRSPVRTVEYSRRGLWLALGMKIKF